MVANVDPIYSRTADIQWATVLVTAGNTSKDLTAGTSYLVFTADAAEGGWVGSLIARAAGTNPATVLRVFINNGSTTGTAANNILRYELTLPATTINEAAQLAPYELALNIALPPGYKIYVTIGTAASPGYYVSLNGGKY